jgi:CheY-like chemotaxis protein
MSGDQAHATASCTLDVLLVSGNRTYANAARIALSAQGCRVTTAMNGSSALAMTSNACFALLLVDERLPGRDGLQLLTQLSAQARGARIVMLMTETSSTYSARVITAGAHAAYPKPPTASGLAGIVRRELLPQPPLLDDALVEELRDAITMPGARAALLARFEKETQALWRAADEALGAGQLQAFAAALHRLRGATASVGALACEARLAGLAIHADGPLLDVEQWQACHALLEQSIAALRNVLLRA